MDIRVVVEDGVPLLVLNGRFDGVGAEAFDAVVAQTSMDSASWVIDAAAVPYISSIGLRSLVALEKSLRERGGGLLLAAPTPFVRQVLRVSRLDGWLRMAPDVPEALATARAAASGPAVERVVAGRRVHLRRLGQAVGTLEWWDAAQGAGAGDRLISATVADLGYAFGTAVVSDAIDGRATPATFIATPLFAGVLGSRGEADFTIGAPADAIAVQVSTAIGLVGAPAFEVRIEAGAPFDIADVFDGLFDTLAEELGATPHALGFVSFAETPGHSGGSLALAVAFDDRLARSSFDREGHLRDWPALVPLPSGRAMLGCAVALGPGGDVPADASLPEALRARARPDALEGLASLDVRPDATGTVIWVFVPHELRSGAEKLLQVHRDDDTEWRPEWESIVRQLYADCRSVTLTPLHGGYMSKTFRAVAYDRDGRRTLPTVLKIGSTALTAREEQANRQYVARFILNNGTTVLGGAREGEWAGLRYNFLGVNGPESRLVWLREHYISKPTSDVVARFDTLLTRVLKPWYAQPKWEQVWLYRDHTPLRLFPSLLDVAERDLGIGSESPRFDCHELGLDLPNPFHFLKHEYQARAAQSRLWYTTVCHGDLNMQNVLVDERENLYVIDFSETRPRNAVSDFARIEPILKFEMLPIDSDEELQRMLEYEEGLTSVTRASQPPPFNYRGTNPGVAHAHAVIELLRRCADTVTLFEEDMVPYWIALLEWTYASVCFVQLSARQKRFAACSAALIVRAIQTAESQA